MPPSGLSCGVNLVSDLVQPAFRVLRLCPPGTIAHSESGALDPDVPVSPSPPRNRHMHCCITRTRTVLFQRRVSKGSLFLGARKLTFPARKCQSGPIWQRGLALAEGAGMLLSPSAAPLFSGGLPRLETIKCCFSVRMWQAGGASHEALTHPIFNPCRNCPNYVPPVARQSNKTPNIIHPIFWSAVPSRALAPRADCHSRSH